MQSLTSVEASVYTSQLLRKFTVLVFRTLMLGLRRICARHTDASQATEVLRQLLTLNLL